MVVPPAALVPLWLALFVLAVPPPADAACGPSGVVGGYRTWGASIASEPAGICLAAEGDAAPSPSGKGSATPTPNEATGSQSDTEEPDEPAPRKQLPLPPPGESEPPLALAALRVAPEREPDRGPWR